MKIVNWQCHFTAHQFDVWNSLQELLGEPIVHVIARLNDGVRKEQGWQAVDISNLKTVMFEGDKGFWDGVNIIRQNPDAIHVFGGFWADRRFFPLILYAVSKGARVVVMNEAYSLDASGYLRESAHAVGQVRKLLRPWVYWGASQLIKWLGRENKICLLAISLRAVEQFAQAGFKKDHIFPFGYFVQKTAHVAVKPNCIASGFQMIYVGSLLKIKGIDFAAKTACALLEESDVNFQFDIFGSGDMGLIEQYLSDKVAYKGVIPFGRAQEVIACYDALILPSRHDGWGVVVNESLLQGVPVIVSDHVGAKCLVEASGAGAVFKFDDAESLKAILRDILAHPEKLETWRKNAQNVAREITPQKAADYLLDVFNFFFAKDGVYPEATWGR